MAVPRALRRLLQVLEIEEEQDRLALETTLGELRQLELTLLYAGRREGAGRRLVVVSAQTGELTDRLAGLEESRAAKRSAAVVQFRIIGVQNQAAQLRQKYLAKRVERRQVEMLIQEAETRDAMISARRGQQFLDDWYLNRGHAAKSRIERDDACLKMDPREET